MITTVQEDPESGELFIEIPQDLLDELGWKIGDDLQWDIVNNQAILTKKE